VHIADLHRLGCSIRAIAGKMGRAASTISRELRRNADPTSGGYHPYAAHRQNLRGSFPDQPERHLAPETTYQEKAVILRPNTGSGVPSVRHRPK
jgi:IS30 family transposase